MSKNTNGPLSGRVRAFAAIILILLPVPVRGQSKQADDQLPKIITGESYWYNHTMGRVLSTSDRGSYIFGTIQARHALSNFRALKEDVNNLDIKTKGVKMAAEELIAWLGTTSRDFAESKLRELTGQTLSDSSAWRDWFQANSNYLVWSDRDSRLIVDEEARQARVPTEQYRKAHPWPKVQ